MRPIAKAHGVPVSGVAVRWILDELPGSAVITGVKSPAQAEANAVALTFTLTLRERQALDEVSR
jgi:aryl-alcohol dehydrogenase-like predicted oxidoreductase